MSKLTKTLTVKKGSTTQNIPFYTTINEANQYGDYGTAIVNGVTAYYPLGAADNANTGSSHKIDIGCIKNGKNLYFLTKGNGELPLYNLVLSATSNQTITLKYKNRNYKDTGYESEVTKTSTSSAQTFSVRKDTTWTASIAASSGYTAGKLSTSSGTVTSNTTVSAGAATLSGFTVTIKSGKKVLYEESEFFNGVRYIYFSVLYTNASGSIVNTGELKHTTGNEVNTFIVKPNTKVTITARTNSSSYHLYLYDENDGFIDSFPDQYPPGSITPATIKKNTTFEFKASYLGDH